MPRKKAQSSGQDTRLQLVTLALRDDTDVHEYRDVHYRLVIDSLQASGQRIASGEAMASLSDTERKRLRKQHVSLFKRICKRYGISGFEGGDPYIVKRDNWLETLRVPLSQPLTIETNWQSSLYSPRVRFFVPPKASEAFPAHSGTVYQLPTLPKRPKGFPPLMTAILDLSQVKRNREADVVEAFKQAVKKCLAELSRRHTKPRSPWAQNIPRDYSRFRLHQQGMPFRWIAFQERSGKRPSGHISGPVPTESSVRESIERIHKVLFGKRYSARRHKSSLREGPLKGAFAAYRCPLHGRDDCPLTCTHAKALMKTTETLLK